MTGVGELRADVSVAGTFADPSDSDALPPLCSVADRKALANVDLGQVGKYNRFERSAATDTTAQVSGSIV